MPNKVEIMLYMQTKGWKERIKRKRECKYDRSKQWWVETVLKAEWSVKMLYMQTKQWKQTKCERESVCKCHGRKQWWV